MENYFTSQRDNIFRNVEVLIYVFDVESRELEKDMHYYQTCLEAILQNSPSAKIFCLVHKMDLVQEDQRDAVRKVLEQIIRMRAAVPDAQILNWLLFLFYRFYEVLFPWFTGSECVFFFSYAAFRRQGRRSETPFETVGLSLFQDVDLGRNTLQGDNLLLWFLDTNINNL
jgi:hypothetical protein